MMTFYDTIKIEHGTCPPDCSACREACAKAKGVTRIKGVQYAEVGFYGSVTCVQCGDPLCQKVCPTGAIRKNRDDGIVRIQDEKCVGCGLCTVLCPYGGIYIDAVSNKAIKCDMCDGNPECVKACEYGALSLVRSRKIYSYLHREDLLPQGTSACLGCPAELGLRFTLKILGRNTILFGGPSCAAGLILRSGVPCHVCLMTNIASTMEGVKLRYSAIGRDVNVVAFAGDGATADVGFQSLSGAAERGANIIYICYDNEGYMNTGMQRSSTTPYRCRTTTTPVGERSSGKEQIAKYMPLIMAFHGIPYVATATLAHLDDYARKLVKAMEVKDGMAYIHLLCPCPTGWGAPTEASIDICKRAVETNYFPLWEAEKGMFRLTYEVKDPEPIETFTKLTRRFSHLTTEDISQFQRTANERLSLMKHLTCRE